MNLDRNQEKAVNHVTGRAIVIAGPGSGKTTVVTARILNLIQTHNILPSQILAIAFNRKAVEEMETRIRRALAASETKTSKNLSSVHSTPSAKTLSPKTINALDLVKSLKSGRDRLIKSSQMNRDKLNAKPLQPKSPSIKSRTKRLVSATLGRPQTQIGVKKNTSTIHQATDSGKPSEMKERHNSVSK